MGLVSFLHLKREADTHIMQIVDALLIETKCLPIAVVFQQSFCVFFKKKKREKKSRKLFS